MGRSLEGTSPSTDGTRGRPGRRASLTPSRRTLAAGAFVCALAPAVALAGCGAGGGGPRAGGALPACAGAVTPVQVPAGWTVPLPPGTVVTHVESTAIRQVIGFAPVSFGEGVAFFREGFPERGYAIGSGDAEMDEAEADFSGHGTRGRWRVNAIAACPDASVITVAAG